MNGNCVADRTKPSHQRVADFGGEIGAECDTESIAVMPRYKQLPVSSSNVHVASTALSSPNTVRVMWSLRVHARDIFILCRALVACDDVDIQRCAPVIKQGLPLIRVDFTLPQNRVSVALHNVLQHVDNAEFGRIQLISAQEDTKEPLNHLQEKIHAVRFAR